MTTVLSQKGQIVLPGVIREQLHLQAGDGFEVTIEDEDTITLRRINQPANCGLVDLLLASPAPFEIPDRENDESVNQLISLAVAEKLTALQTYDSIADSENAANVSKGDLC